MTFSTDRKSGTTLALVVLGVAAVLFGILTVNVIRDDYFDWDIALMTAIQSYRTPWLDALTNAVAWIGFPPQSNIVIGVFVLVLFVLGLRWEALCTAFAATITAVVWFQIAPLINRPRPSDDLVPVGSSIPLGGYPSGHVLILTAVIGFLGYVAYVHLRSPGLRSAAVAVAAVYLAALGYARVYAGDHWPSDVLGGYLLGTVFLMVTILLQRWLTRHRKSSD